MTELEVLELIDEQGVKVKLTQEIRETLLWGTYGKLGDEPLHYVKLMDMTNAHIEAVLRTQHQITSGRRSLYEQELEMREESNIEIRD